MSLAEKAGSSIKSSQGKPRNEPSQFLHEDSNVEQYEDSLENLDTEVDDRASAELPFEDPAFALRYRLDKTSRSFYCGVDRFISPFGYSLKRAAGLGEAQPCEADLIETIPYLFGMDVDRLYREPQRVVIVGVTAPPDGFHIFPRLLCRRLAASVASKISNHPADRFYTNDPATLAFQLRPSRSA